MVLLTHLLLESLHLLLHGMLHLRLHLLHLMMNSDVYLRRDLLLHFFLQLLLYVTMDLAVHGLGQSLFALTSLLDQLLAHHIARLYCHLLVEELQPVEAVLLLHLELLGAGLFLGKLRT